MRGVALVLAAHGSRHHPEVNATIDAYAARLGELVGCSSAVAAYHQGNPTFAEVLDGLREERVVVVPLMTSSGYYADEVLPRELRKNRTWNEKQVVVMPPVGTHSGMADLVAGRFKELTESFSLPAQATTLAIIGHGTKRNPRSRLATKSLTKLLSARQTAGEVLEAFIDEEPDVASLMSRSTHDALVVIPFLIGAGPHALGDIPAALSIATAEPMTPPFSAQASGKRLIIDQTIGQHAGILDLAADQARTAMRDWRESSPSKQMLRLGTRGSQLAIWQAEHVAANLREYGVAVEIRRIETSGDQQLDVAIADLPSDSPFSDAIDAALASGEIDIAVHSLKDLPADAMSRGTIAAVLPRGDARETLVSRDGTTLDDLRAGSVIGTSSPRRSAQIRFFRPDVHTRIIRGSVEDRVRQVKTGQFDAAILAAAGLERLDLLHEVIEYFDPDRFLPAPAQAAIAVEVRPDDRETAACVRILDDEATRKTVTAEMALLSRFDANKRVALAALAECRDDGTIVMTARLFSTEGEELGEVRVSGDDPEVLAAGAGRALAALQAEGMSRAG